MDIFTFTDFDEFAATVRDVSIEVSLMDLARRRWTIRHAEPGGIHLQMGCQESADLVEGQSRDDGPLLDFPLTHGRLFSRLR